MPRLLAPIDMAYTTVESPFAQFPFPQVLAAGTIAETPIGLVGAGVLNLDLNVAQVHPSAAWVASNGAYFTITINRRTNATPATAIPIAIGTGQLFGTGNGMGSGVQWKGSSLFTQSGTGSFLLPNDAITFSVSQTGGGLILGGATGSFVGIYLKGY
jgi:hypothetical protein